VRDLPALVQRAVALARREGFGNSCRPEHGRLLSAPAAGAESIGEAGTGEQGQGRAADRAPGHVGAAC